MNGTPHPAAVAYVLTHHPRTTQTFITAEIDELRSRGHRVEVFAMNRPGSDQIRTAADQREMDSTTYLKAAGAVTLLGAVRRALLAAPSGFLRTAWKAVRSAGTDPRRAVWRLFHLVEATLVWDRCRQLGITLVHAHFGGPSSTIGWLAVTLGRAVGSGPAELVVTVHGASEIEDVADSVPDLKARDARAIVAVSDYTRAQLMRRVPAELWHRIRVLRCGVDLEKFEFAPRPVSGTPTVLFVGRLAEAKGASLLIDAVAQCRSKGHSVRLELVGGGEFEKQLRQQAQGRDWVHFAGELTPDDVRSRLVEADVFCLPSLDEGIPVSVMEAMAMGTPVVATAVAGIPELAVDERTALLVPPGQVDGLSAAIERILDDPALTERLCLAARRRVELRHDASTNLPELIALLAESEG